MSPSTAVETDQGGGPRARRAGRAFTVGVLRAAASGERRVALVPESVGPLTGAGMRVVVESGAGEAAWFPDHAYTAAGATVAGLAEVVDRADALVAVGSPPDEAVPRMRAGQAVIGLLHPLT